MRIPNNHNLLRSRATVACCSVLSIAFVSATIHAEDQPAVVHFIDTNTDRVPAQTVFPKYPSIARRDRIEGEAVVCFKIRADGRISRPVVTERTHKIFAKPSLQAVKKSYFEPLGPGQVLDTSRTCRTFRFRLDPIVVKRDQKEEG